MLPVIPLQYVLASLGSLVVYGVFQLAVVGLYGHTGKLDVFSFSLLVAFTNCLGCVLSILTAVGLSPRLRKKNRQLMSAFSALAVAVYQLIGLVGVLNYSESVGNQIMLLSVVYYGGLLSACAVACYMYERGHAVAIQQKRIALEALAGPSLYTQALARLDRRPDSLPFAQLEGDIEDTVIVTPFAASQFVPTSTIEDNEPITFLDFDLILLEDELLRIRPDKDAYISAMRLGLAIEKDQGYSNVRARNFTFSQLMKDVAMRLSVSCISEGQSESWSEIAQELDTYGKVSSEQRCVIAREMELLLLDSVRAKTPPAKREPVLISV